MIERTRDNKFEIKRIVRIDGTDEQVEKLKFIREQNGYDVLIKSEKDGLFLLCNEISDAQIISEEIFNK
mgnify:CR=1 FL=1